MEIEYTIGPLGRGVRAAALIVMGVIFVLVGSAARSSCLSLHGSGCDVPLIFVLIGILLILGGIVSIAYVGRSRPPLGYNPAVPPPLLPIGGAASPPAPPVRCRYCGSTSDASLPRCPNCGAPR